ncbi:MAG: cobalt-precorrin 5A hydrolase [Lachnospiraceae bacterium]|nr:cobalt-precorrin 5A hydrolase [Lachnospiraceae bacterium]
MDNSQKKIIRIIYFTEAGGVLAERIRSFYGDRGFDVTASSGKGKGIYKAWTEENFQTDKALIFIGACGIAVRAIAPFVRSKKTDPAVIVCDEKGNYIIPILSGHIGEANAYAREIASFTGGQAVLTTATDVNHLLAVDVFATENGMHISDMLQAKDFSSALLQERKARFFLPRAYRGDILFGEGQPEEIEIIECESRDPAGFGEGNSEKLLFGSESRATDCLISPEIPSGQCLQLIPSCLLVGIGCRRGKGKEELSSFLKEVLDKERLSLYGLSEICSVDVKKDEAGLIALSRELGLPFRTFSAESLREVKGEFTASTFVKSQIGVDNVCERSVMAAGAKRLLVSKQAKNGMTIAVGIKETVLKWQ